MGEANLAINDILLGEGLIDEQRAAIEGHIAAGRQAMKSVNPFRRDVVRVGRIEHRRGQDDGLTLQQAGRFRAACARSDVDRRVAGQCGRVCGHRCRRYDNAEGIDRQRAVLGRRVVDTAVTQIRQDPLPAILTVNEIASIRAVVERVMYRT